MPTNHRHQVSDETPMSRNDLAVGAAIARLEAGHSHLGDRLDQGFSRIDQQFGAVNATLGKLTDHLAQQDKVLSSLVESRNRGRAWGKRAWQVTGALIVALILVALGLK